MCDLPFRAVTAAKAVIEYTLIITQRSRKCKEQRKRAKKCAATYVCGASFSRVNLDIRAFTEMCRYQTGKRG